MDDTTESDDVRWKYLASFVTVSLIGTLTVLVIGGALGVLTLSAISQAWFVLFATAVVSAIAWVYGEDFVDWRDDKSNN